MAGSDDERRPSIDDYFSYLAERAGFLSKLRSMKREQEALLLTCCYIEAMGNSRYGPGRGRRRNFVDVLVEHGGDSRFSAVFPWQLKCALARLRRSWVAEAMPWIDELVASHSLDLMGIESFRDFASQHFAPDLLDRVSEHLWRGTIAAFIYERVRNELVHQYDSVPVTLGRYRVDGKPIGGIDLNLMLPALQEIIGAMRKISVESSRLFGHDFRYGDTEGNGLDGVPP